MEYTEWMCFLCFSLVFFFVTFFLHVKRLPRAGGWGQGVPGHSFYVERGVDEISWIVCFMVLH